MVVRFCLSLEIASLIDLSVQPQSEDEYMLTNPQSKTPRKINDSDLLSSVISKSEFWHIPPSWARFLHRWLFLGFLAYFKIKQKEDKKIGKVLGNEKGLKHVTSWKQDKALSLGCLRHSFPLVSKSLGILTVVRDALQFVEGTLKSQWLPMWKWLK